MMTPNKLILTALTVATFTICGTAYAVDLQEVDASEMPFSFVNGEVADADKVNENFEYLRANLQAVVDHLKTPTIVNPPSFSGNFMVTGTESALDLCDGVSERSTIRHISGEANSAAGIISVETVRTDFEVSSRSGFSSSSINESFDVSIDVTTGQISSSSNPLVTGRMAADALSFVLTYGGTESNGGCSHAYVGHLSGIRQ